MVSEKEVKLYKVLCPYCTVGHALVDVSKSGGAHSTDVGPRQCSMCDRYFKIKVNLHLTGEPLEEVNWQESLRTSLREMF